MAEEITKKEVRNTPEKIVIGGKPFGIAGVVVYDQQKTLGGGLEGLVSAYTLKNPVPENNWQVPRRLAVKTARSDNTRGLIGEASTLAKLGEVEKEWQTHYIPRLFMPHSVRNNDESLVGKWQRSDELGTSDYFIMEVVDPGYCQRLKYEGYDPSRLPDYEEALDIVIQMVDIEMLCLTAGISQSDRKIDDYRFNPVNHNLMVLDWGVQGVIRTEEDRKWAQKKAVFRLLSNILQWQTDDRYDNPRDQILRDFPVEFASLITDVFLPFHEAIVSKHEQISTDSVKLEGVQAGLLTVYKDLVHKGIALIEADLPYLEQQLKAIQDIREKGISGHREQSINQARIYLKDRPGADAASELSKWLKGVDYRKPETSPELFAFRRWLSEREVILRMAIRYKTDRWMYQTHGTKPGSIYERYDNMAKRAGLGDRYMIARTAKEIEEHKEEEAENK